MKYLPLFLLLFYGFTSNLDAMKRKRSKQDDSCKTHEDEEKASPIEKIKLIGNSILEIVQTNDKEEETIEIVNSDDKKDTKIVIGLAETQDSSLTCNKVIFNNVKISIDPESTFTIFNEDISLKPIEYLLKVHRKQNLEIITKDFSSLFIEQLECDEIIIKTYDQSTVTVNNLKCKRSALNENGTSSIIVNNIEYDK